MAAKGAVGSSELAAPELVNSDFVWAYPMNVRRIEPGPGQESVWDYPRPPRLEESPRHVRVISEGTTLADTRRALRMLETSHPPVYYMPPEDVQMDCLILLPRRTFCEWKGTANYFDVRVGDRPIPEGAWCYPDPVPKYAAMKGYIGFYANKFDCYLDDEKVEPQPGDFYGGWITKEIVGPFKGGSGTFGW